MQIIIPSYYYIPSATTHEKINFIKAYFTGMGVEPEYGYLIFAQRNIHPGKSHLLSIKENENLKKWMLKQPISIYFNDIEYDSRKYTTNVDIIEGYVKIITISKTNFKREYLINILAAQAIYELQVERKLFINIHICNNIIPTGLDIPKEEDAIKYEI